MASEWRTIDSAPMDGTAVLLWDGIDVILGLYDQPDTLEEWWDNVGDGGEPDKEGYAEYVDESPSGWMSHDPLNGDELVLTPTHWMSVPPPPLDD